MNKKLLTLATLALIICSAIFIQQVSSDTISQPAKLNLTVNPPSIPSDNNAYECIFIQLQDASGIPARAQQDTTISLSSSLTEIGTVDPTITIKTGDTYGTANFYATFTPGKTTITATATGYETVQAVATTIGPKPYTLGAFGFPALLPADGEAHEAIMVQLQDYSGSPAKAPIGGTKVTLSCSNTAVGDVTSEVTIPEGNTYAVATFTTTLVPGVANVTALASDYGSTSTTITTQTPLLTSIGSLKILTGPTKVLADNIAYHQIVVEVMSGNNLGAAASNIVVTVASADESIGKTDEQITILAGASYGVATFNSTYKAGSTTITAAATNFAAANRDLTTTGFTASKLAVYCAPSSLPADKKEYQAVIVQLQDAQGRPAQAPANLLANLFSSQPEIATVDSTITVSLGQTYATGMLTVTNAPGESIVTAQASNYNIGQATVTTKSVDLTHLGITVTADPQVVFNGNQTEITTHITADGSAIVGATLQFTSNNNGTFSQPREDQPGYYKTTFTAPSFQQSTTCTITVNASKSGYLSSLGTVQVTVVPPSSEIPTTNASSTGSLVSTVQLRFRIIDDSGNGVSGAEVFSVSQPAGMTALSAVSNDTGYVVFQDIDSGSYSFQVQKDGYETLLQAVDFNGAKMAMSLPLNTQAQEDNTLLIVVALIVAVVIAIVAIVLVKRRKPTKAKTLEPLNWPMTQ